MNTFEPKYAKFFLDGGKTPCTWEQMKKEELAKFCDQAAETFFLLSYVEGEIEEIAFRSDAAKIEAYERDFKNFNAIIANQNEQIRKLEKGRTVRNWLLFASVCFAFFIMLYDAGVLF